MPRQSALNQLRDALAELYPDIEDAARVAACVSPSIGARVSRGKPLDDWQAILEEAEQQGLVEAIIEVATARYPKDTALLEAAVSYYRTISKGRSPALAPAAPAAGSPSLSTPAAAPASAAQAALAPLQLDLGRGVSLALLRVPAGEFLIGSTDTDSPYGTEKPQHRLLLAEYLIGRYPVTVAQYRAFLQASPQQVASLDGAQEPDDHPVTHVSWFEALAFCAWASQVSGQMVRLPSEAEWEKAARGTDGRIYPWGNRWDPQRCNSAEAEWGHTTPAGRYSPLSDSPYGCADMAGNVWEWTRSLCGQNRNEPQFGYPYNPADGRENLEAADDFLRVMRGGAFTASKMFIRCAFRLWMSPHDRYNDGGFRVMVCRDHGPR